MIEGRQAILLAVLAALVLGVGACDRRGKLRKAREEAEKAKAELEGTKIALGKVRTENNQLSAEIANLADKLEQAKLELTELRQAYTNLQNQVGTAVSDRNALMGREATAQSAIENLRKELAEKTEEVRELNEWVKELQATIGELQGQPQPEPEPPTPEPEPNAEPAPVADENTTE